MEAKHRPPAALDLVGVVCVHHEREDRAVDAGGRLDHVRDIGLAARLVEVLELLARMLRVLREVEVAAVRDALELLPDDREQVLDVARRR